MLSITYLSAASSALTPEQLANLVTQARASNAELGITGILVYSAGTFVQTLEGPQPAVSALYDRIVSDARHTEVIEVWRETTLHRTFSTWTMAFKELTPEEAAAVPELHEVLQDPPPAAGESTLSPQVLLSLVADEPGPTA